MTAHVNSMRAQSAGRITRQDLFSMKSKADVKPNPLALLKKLADATASESCSFVSFMGELKKATSSKPDTCKYSGHVLDSDWQGSPRCSECNYEITSVHELRAGCMDSKAKTDKPIEFWVDPSLKQRRMGFISAR